MFKQIEIQLKKLLLKILLLFKSSKKIKPQTDFSNIMLIRLNRIGDALVTTPLIKVLKESLDCKITVLADSKNHFVFKHNPFVDEVLIFNKGLKGFFEIKNYVIENKINTIVDLHDDVSTTVTYLMALINAPNKFALQKKIKNIYTKTVPRPDPKQTHIIERILEIRKLFGIVDEVPKDLRVVYKPKKENLIQAKTFFKNTYSGNAKIIGVNISAGSDARFWGTENYKKLISFLKKYSNDLILFSAKSDIKYAREIADNDTLIYPVSENFDRFASGISNLVFLITPDTSVVHLASAFNIPMFGIYVHYNTTDMIWTPYNIDFEVIVTKEPTLKNITFDEVRNKLNPFLEKYFASKSE